MDHFNKTSDNDWLIMNSDDQRGDYGLHDHQHRHTNPTNNPLFLYDSSESYKKAMEAEKNKNKNTSQSVAKSNEFLDTNLNKDFEEEESTTVSSEGDCTPTQETCTTDSVNSTTETYAENTNSILETYNKMEKEDEEIFQRTSLSSAGTNDSPDIMDCAITLEKKKRKKSGPGAFTQTLELFENHEKRVRESTNNNASFISPDNTYLNTTTTTTTNENINTNINIDTNKNININNDKNKNINTNKNTNTINNINTHEDEINTLNDNTNNNINNPY